MDSNKDIISIENGSNRLELDEQIEQLFDALINGSFLHQQNNRISSILSSLRARAQEIDNLSQESKDRLMQARVHSIINSAHEGVDPVSGLTIGMLRQQQQQQ